MKSWKRERDFLKVMRESVKKETNARDVRFVRNSRGGNLLEVTLKDDKKFRFEVGPKLGELKSQDFNQVLRTIKMHHEEEQ